MDNNHVIATGFSLPPYFLRGKVVIINTENESGKISLNGFQPSGKQYPLTLRAQGLNDFTFPLDPIISVSMKNIITRRTVAKGKKRGTVKERWTEDDAEITITGVFISPDGEYPAEVEQLRAFFNQHQAIDVICDILNQKDINQIVIESLDFPHTKGEENQSFEIKAYSDDVFQLLIES
jgi:hypothetical protein